MTWRVGVDRELPVEGGEWDGAKASQSVLNGARNAEGKIIASRARRAFLIYDDANAEVTAGYKLPVSRRRQDGSLVANADALRNALSRIPQVEDVPAAVKERAADVAKALLDKFNEQRGDDILSLFGTRNDKIVRREGQWCAVSADGSKSFGCFDTESEARERLRQVEAAKAARDSVSPCPVGLVWAPDGPRATDPDEQPVYEVWKAAKDARRDSENWVTRIDRLGPIQFVQDDEQADEGSFAARLTPEGFLKIDGFISSVGVYQYSDGDKTWGEFRSASEVFDAESLASFEMVPVCDEHPKKMVDASNIKDVQAGHLGSNVRKSADGRHVAADILITDADLIKKIRGGKTQLSNGYEALVVAADGVTDDGTPFSAKQTKIRGNHTAVVDLARGGPTCRLLLDAADGAFSLGDQIMKIKKKKDGTVVIEGTDHEVPDAVSAAFDALRAKVEEQAAELAKLSDGDAKDQEEEEEKTPPAADQEEEEENKDSVSLAKMQAKIDSMEAVLKTERDSASTKIDARVALVVKARDILGDEAKTDGISDVALMRAVVAKVTPAMKSKVDKGSADYVSACYEMALDTHSTRVDSTTELLTLTHEAIKTDEVDLDSLYSKHLDARRNNWVASKEAN